MDSTHPIVPATSTLVTPVYLVEGHVYCWPAVTPVNQYQAMPLSDQGLIQGIHPGAAESSGGFQKTEANEEGMDETLYSIKYPHRKSESPDSERSTPECKTKREKNKRAVKKHRRKLSDYLETAPKNIQNMEHIASELDKNIKETEHHIKVLKEMLAKHESRTRRVGNL